ncbi:putative transcription factor bZIP family [Helianthus annuus]|nr:putative transcription factor bZIP family [Helianthus annuus]
MTTPPEDDNWVNSALTDTDLVVHLLVNLRSSPPSPPKTWTIRQPRSKPPPPPTKSQPTRASPTTPLSYSCATTSVSAGVEESSRLLHSDGSRSKVIGSNETTPTKRPRKKKTLAELREDETRLLKERKQLKRQLASLQATCQKHRKDNESLKKMKDDMKSQVLASSKENDCVEGKKNDGFVLPDLNIPAGEDY